MFLLATPNSTIHAYWWISLAIALVVTLVVWLLLHTLASTVDRIEEGAAEVWRVGTLIANNTIHILLLQRTNQIVARILTAAGAIAAATSRIRRAALRGKGEEAGHA